MLVFHDLLGFVQHPHHAKVMPKFCKRYSAVGEVINKALTEFNDEVKNHVFPGKEYSPYPIEDEELNKLCKALEEKGMALAAEAAHREHVHHLKSTEQ